MKCIKTGAYVSLPDYGLFAAVDLYKVAGTIVVRFNGDPRECQHNYRPQRPITHTVALNYAGENFIKFEAGIIVVEDCAVTIHSKPEEQTQCLESGSSS